MIDLVFDVSGGPLPAAYPYALWNELARLVPLLGGNNDAGVVPMRLAESAEGMLLPRRAKLVLRLPHDLAEVASCLAQQTLLVAGTPLLLGGCSIRAIQPYPTLHARLVAGAEDEAAFVAEMETALAAMGVRARLICGQHRTLIGDGQRISGYSLVLHDLAPDDSLRVQYAGLGGSRHLGCGIFLPYKVITGLE
jgi:CRISPR-associated protein Cas6